MERLPDRLPDPIKEFIFEPPVTPPIWPRRLYHLLAGSVAPIAALFAPETPMLWVLVSLSIVSVLTEAGRALVPAVNNLVVDRLPLFKPAEREHVTGATYMVIGTTLIFLVFDKEIAILSLLFLAAGDPAAAIVGSRARRGRIFGKSIAGTVAFAAAAGLAGALIAIHPAVPLMWWLVPGVLVAAIAELLPFPLDDNITVPLASAATMTLLAVV